MVSDLAAAVAHAAVAFVRGVLVDFVLFNIGRGALLACTLAVIRTDACLNAMQAGSL
jgi:hypothetical protein